MRRRPRFPLYGYTFPRQIIVKDSKNSADQLACAEFRPYHWPFSIFVASSIKPIELEVGDRDWGIALLNQLDVPIGPRIGDRRQNRPILRCAALLDLSLQYFRCFTLAWHVVWPSIVQYIV